MSKAGWQSFPLKSTPTRHSNTGLVMHPRSLFRKACQLVLSPPRAQASFFGVVPGRGQVWCPGQSTQTFKILSSLEVKEPHSVRAQAVGCQRERKTPTALSPPQVPTSLYLFIYLGKGPKAQAGNGPIPAG